jgi:dihydroneopterin aldolase
MTIHVEDLKFQCIIGILDFERVTPQDVIINLTVDYVYENEFINYVEITDTVKFNMIENKYMLIEDSLSDISLKLQEKFSTIKTLHLKITKPSILPDCKVSVSHFYNFNS